MKKLISAILSFALLCSFASPAFAASVSDSSQVLSAAEVQTPEEIKQFLKNSPDTVVTNEYDALKQRQAEARELLRQNSINTTQEEYQEAVDILAIDPVAIFYELKEKGEPYLREHGYSETQINAILNFDGSEDAIYRASATVSGNLSILSQSTVGTTRKFTAKYTFAWNGAVSFSYKHLTAINSELFYLIEGSSKNDALLYYDSTATSTVRSTYAPVVRMQKCNGHGAGVDIDHSITVGTTTQTVYNIDSGYMIAEFDNLNGDRQTGISGLYVVSSVQVSPSLSATLQYRNASASLSFDLKFGQTESARRDTTVRFSS